MTVRERALAGDSFSPKAPRLIHRCEMNRSKGASFARRAFHVHILVMRIREPFAIMSTPTTSIA